MRKIRVGTRGSKLALAQAWSLEAQLVAMGAEVEIVTIKTSGDLGNRDAVGAFVREIQQAVLERRVDVALHCLKDLPTEPVPGLQFAAFLEREDPLDALITRHTLWVDLAPGSIVGTGSLRRTSQLSALRGDFRYRRLIGNVDTRLNKLLEGEYDAIVLAVAGLKRLRAPGEALVPSDLSLEVLESGQMLPAPGQAILVLESLEDNTDLTSFLSALDHAPTKAAALAERAFLNTFGGGCSVPVAALASADGMVRLQGLVASPDGRTILRGEQSGADPVELGGSLAQELGDLGGFEIVRSVIGERVVSA